MARPSSPKVGRGPCPSCREPVTFRLSSGGMLTHKCDACDSSGYAEPGGQAYRDRMASLTERYEGDGSERKELPAAKTGDDEVRPAPPRANSVFSMERL